MKIRSLISVSLIIATVLSGCARDLSSNVYTEDSTLSLTLQGKVISMRPVTVKHSDDLRQNSTGMLAGGLVGGIAGSNVGKGDGRLPMLAGGVLAGALLGSLAESALSKADGIEYIVKIDKSSLSDGYYEGSAVMRNAISSARTSGIITVVQGKENPVSTGQNVFVILSPKRARVIAS